MVVPRTIIRPNIFVTFASAGCTTQLSSVYNRSDVGGSRRVPIRIARDKLEVIIPEIGAGIRRAGGSVAERHATQPGQ